jgi:membrane-associated phospholipid phosphatase
MPSLHASYPFMLFLFFWPAGWLVRIGLGLYTLAMAFTLVYGGEHFIIDALVGYVLTLICFGIVTMLWRVIDARRDSTPEPAPTTAEPVTVAAEARSAGP